MATPRTPSTGLGHDPPVAERGAKRDWLHFAIFSIGGVAVLGLVVELFRAYITPLDTLIVGRTISCCLPLSHGYWRQASLLRLSPSSGSRLAIENRVAHTCDDQEQQYRQERYKRGINAGHQMTHENRDRLVTCMASDNVQCHHCTEDK